MKGKRIVEKAVKLLVIAMMFSFIFGTFTSEAAWKKTSAGYKYTVASNRYATGWKKISGKYYYFDKKGVRKSGWQTISGKKYYFGTASTGYMRTGWQTINGKKYYFGSGSAGYMRTGWQKISGKRYYFGTASTGYMRTGWQKISGKTYYFGGSKDGAMKKNTWVTSTKYVGSNGAYIPNYAQQLAAKEAAAKEAAEKAAKETAAKEAAEKAAKETAAKEAAEKAAKEAAAKEAAEKAAQEAAAKEAAEKAAQEAAAKEAAEKAAQEAAAKEAAEKAAEEEAKKATENPDAGNTADDQNQGENEDAAYDREAAAQAFDLINEYRASQGKAALEWNEELLTVSDTRASEAESCQGHTRPDGTPWYTVSDLTDGENIAWGYQSAESLLGGWQGSAKHNANLLGGYTSAAISAHVSENGVYYWSMEFQF